MVQPVRKKVGRPRKSEGATSWSAIIKVRPYITVDFRDNPAVHSLLYENPDYLNEMVVEALDLLIQKKNMKYANPEYRRGIPAKILGLTHAHEAETKPLQVKDYEAADSDSINHQASLEQRPSSSMMTHNAINPLVESSSAKHVLAEKPKEAPRSKTNVSSFLMKAISDAD